MKKIFSCLIALWLFSLTGCATVTTSTYPILDSKVRAVDSIKEEPQQKIHWLDNDHILFIKYSNDYKEREDGQKIKSNDYYIWNTESNTLKAYGIISGNLCYFNGFIAYWNYKIENNKYLLNKRVWYLGEFNKTTKAIEVKETDIQKLDWTKCRPMDPAVLETKALLEKIAADNGDPIRPHLVDTDYTDKVLVELHSFLAKDDAPPEWLKDNDVQKLGGHGFLDLGIYASKRNLKNSPVRFYRTGDRDGILMPFGTEEFSYYPNYYEFKNAYFIVGQYFDNQLGRQILWPKNLPRTAWWLYPNGKVEEIKMSFEHKNDIHWSSFLPTRNGVFLPLDEYVPGTLNNIGNSGGYFITSSNSKNLVPGRLKATTVSPDGCRVAYVLHPNPFEEEKDATRITLQMIDLCKE